MIDSDAHFCSPGPIASASHKSTHKKETNTHRQSVWFTQSQEYFKEELIVGKWFGEYPILGRVLPRSPGCVLPRSQETKDHLLRVPYCPICDEKWSRTHIFKKFMVPWVVRNSPNNYLNVLSTDLSTRSIDHGWYRRSIRIHLLENTVDINGRRRFTYGELRLIVDRRLEFEILWSISSTNTCGILTTIEIETVCFHIFSVLCTWQDYLANRATKKMWFKNWLEIEKYLLYERWGCGCTETFDSGQKLV